MLLLQISEQEHLLFPHCIGKGALPLQICSLERTVQTPPRLHRLGVLQAAFFRQLMKGDAAGSHRLELHGNAVQQSASQDGQDRLLGQSLTLAKADLKRFVAELEKQHWQLSPFMLSSTEQAGFIVLDK